MAVKTSAIKDYNTAVTYLKGAFAGKEKNWSDYNAFMQANLGEGIYMTEQQHALGYSLPLPPVTTTSPAGMTAIPTRMTRRVLGPD